MRSLNLSRCPGIGGCNSGSGSGHPVANFDHGFEFGRNPGLGCGSGIGHSTGEPGRKHGSGGGLGTGHYFVASDRSSDIDHMSGVGCCKLGLGGGPVAGVRPPV